MRKYILINRTIGREYQGNNIAELYEIAMREGSQYDTFNLKSIPVVRVSKSIKPFIEYMMELDPNGSWDESLEEDGLTTEELLYCMCGALSRWAAEATTLLERTKYYRKIMEIEEIL